MALPPRNVNGRLLHQAPCLEIPGTEITVHYQEPYDNGVMLVELWTYPAIHAPDIEPDRHKAVDFGHVWIDPTNDTLFFVFDAYDKPEPMKELLQPGWWLYDAAVHYQDTVRTGFSPTNPVAMILFGPASLSGSTDAT